MGLRNTLDLLLQLQRKEEGEGGEMGGLEKRKKGEEKEFSVNLLDMLKRSWNVDSRCYSTRYIYGFT